VNFVLSIAVLLGSEKRKGPTTGKVSALGLSLPSAGPNQVRFKGSVASPTLSARARAPPAYDSLLAS